MDLTHFHLMFNHVPVMGVVFGFLILLGGVIMRSKPGAAVGLVVLGLSAVVAIPVYFTGESAEELVEGLPGVTEAFTGEHEAAASLSLGLTIAAGVFAVATLFLNRRLTPRVPGYLMIATLFLSLLTGISMVRTANLGGQIRHTELRSSAPTKPAGEPNTADRKTKDDDDHD